MKGHVLFEFNQELPFGHRVTHLYVKGRNRSIKMGLDVILHLHGLENEERISLLNRRTRFHQYLEDQSGHRSINATLMACNPLIGTPGCQQLVSMVPDHGFSGVRPVRQLHMLSTTCLNDYRNRSSISMEQVAISPDVYQPGTVFPKLLRIHGNSVSVPNGYEIRREIMWMGIGHLSCSEFGSTRYES